MYRGPVVDELMRTHPPRKGKVTSFPPPVHGQTIKQWTVKSEANFPGSWYTRTNALKPECREEMSTHVAGEIESLLGPKLYDTYVENLKPRISSKGRGARYEGGFAPPLPKPTLAPGVPLELSGTLKLPSPPPPPAAPVGAEGSELAALTAPPSAPRTQTHQVMWTSFGPMPNHAYVEGERLGTLDDWFDRCAAAARACRGPGGARARGRVRVTRASALAPRRRRFGRPSEDVGQHAHTRWVRSSKRYGGVQSQAVAMKRGNLTR